MDRLAVLQCYDAQYTIAVVARQTHRDPVSNPSVFLPVGAKRRAQRRFSPRHVEIGPLAPDLFLEIACRLHPVTAPA